MSSVPSISTDTSSTAYKKAKRQYLKTTKARNKDVELDWTPFRAAEKKYKAHFPPPDLSQVLDLATLDSSRAEEIKLGGWCGSSNVVDCREIRLNQNDGKKAYGVTRIPGATSPTSIKRSLISVKIRLGDITFIFVSGRAETSYPMVTYGPSSASQSYKS